MADGLNWSHTKTQLESNGESSEKASESDKHQIQQIPKFEKLEEGKTAVPIPRKNVNVPMADNISSNLVPSMSFHELFFVLVLKYI